MLTVGNQGHGLVAVSNADQEGTETQVDEPGRGDDGQAQIKCPNLDALHEAELAGVAPSEAVLDIIAGIEKTFSDRVKELLGHGPLALNADRDGEHETGEMHPWKDSDALILRPPTGSGKLPAAAYESGTWDRLALGASQESDSGPQPRADSESDAPAIEETADPAESGPQKQTT